MIVIWWEQVQIISGFSYHCNFRLLKFKEKSKSDVVDNEQITYQGVYDIPHHFSNISYLKATKPESNFSTSFS